jgi:hypothetical protein
MRIGENIEALELPMNLMGQSSVIYPALLWDSDGVTLVDTGTPGQLSAIRQHADSKTPAWISRAFTVSSRPTKISTI